MKILFCNKYNFPFSGTEVYLFELMQMLRDQGHEVALFSMSDPRGERTPFDHYFVPHINFKDSRQGWIRKIHLAGHAVYSREARRALRRMLEEFQPDVAHVRNIYHHLSPSIFWELKQHGVPVLYHLNDFKLLCPNYNLTAHGKTCERCHGGRYWKVVSEGCYHGGRRASVVLAAEAYVHRWLRTYQKCVDLFLAPSEFVRHKLIAEGWSANRIQVLPHFQRLSREEPPGPSEGRTVLYFGRLSAEKGVEDLLLAMRDLPDARLVIAGEGPEHRRLDNLVERNSLGNVEFAGHVQGSELERRISEARFTVLPSHAYETLGKTILESYAQARGVVATDLGSRPEFVKHGETGLLYRVGDIEQLSVSMRFLLDHPGRAEEMGRAGREFVRDHHSPPAHYEVLNGLYEKLAMQLKTPRLTCSANPQRRNAARSRIRVAFIGGRGVIGKYSGIEGYYEEVGRRLAAAGHEVTVYCRNYFTPPQDQHNGMHLVRLPAPRSKHFETVTHTLLSTLHSLWKPYDIVHYHTLGPALFSFVPRLVGKRTVVTVQGLDWQRKKWGHTASAVLRAGEYAAIHFPHETMVVSQTLQRYFQMRYRTQTRYVANGAALRHARPLEHIRAWGLESGNYILFLGRFSPEKNCHLLVEAFEQIETTTKLVLAGGGARSDPYVQKLRQHASDRILLLDYVAGDRFEELLTNAMLFVLPSDLEGLSLALLEAMGAGLCVLVSDIPENRELMQDAGFTFRAGDRRDLRRMLTLLIHAKFLREAAGQAARKRIEEQYLWSDIASQIERAYRQIMGWNPGDEELSNQRFEQEPVATSLPAMVPQVKHNVAMANSGHKPSVAGPAKPGDPAFSITIKQVR